MLQNQPKFQPRPGGFGKISARRNDSSSPTNFNRQTKVRPLTPDSLLSEEDLKLTKEQHPCSQNLGMATAFLLPLAMVRIIIDQNIRASHYANMSVQYTAIFHGCKNGNFQMKKM